MRAHTRHSVSILIIAWVVGEAYPAWAQETDILELYGNDDLISLATGSEQPLKLAPAVATVINAKDIENLGARTLAEVLERVPGLHVSNARGLSDVFEIRGFYSTFNVRVLVLVNGIPVNNVVYGGPPVGWSLPAQVIERIEVVRGPGSALYGADAYAGVINVITKSGADIQGNEAGVFGGSFGTGGGWWLKGLSHGDWDAALSVVASTTDGYRVTVEADDQTRLDQLFGTSASLAPGPVNAERDDVDLRLDLAHGERWRLRLGYQAFLNMGTGVGTALALDPKGKLDIELVNADLTYKPQMPGLWDSEVRLGFLHTTTTADTVLLPPGTLGNAFPEGVRNKGKFRIAQYQLDTKLKYEGFASHTLSLGLGASYAQNDTVYDLRNYRTAPGGLVFPAGVFSDVEALGDEPVLPDVDRKAAYALIQDEWRLGADWTLTSGLRFDYFSDFGTTLNPRLALVWNRSPSSTVKLLYGRSFRAPTFLDLYSNSDIVALGDRDNRPETLNMVELALIKEWTPNFSAHLNLFWYQAEDVLSVVPLATALPTRPAVHRNIGGYSAHGLELETQYRIDSDADVYFNYAFQEPDDEANQAAEAATVAPRHQVYAELNWRLSDHWRLNTNLAWLPEESNYLFGNAALHYSGDNDRWRFSVSARNLFDNDLREPALFPDAEALPGGVPLPGRSLRAEFKIRF